MAIDWDAHVLAPCDGVFGEPVAYTTAAGASVPGITGIYDSAYRDIALIDPLGSNEPVPVLGVRVMLFPTPPVPDDIVFVPSANITYVVREVRADGHGWAKLMLGRMASP